MTNENVPNFTPVLLGSDFNVYGMARSFYELYGKRVKAYAQERLAPTRFTKIVDLTFIPGFSEDPVWFEEMKKLKQKYASHKEPVILIGCGDGYAELISKHKKDLEDVFVCPYVDYSLIKQLNSKENFYKMCDKYGMPYPGTKIISKNNFEKDNFAQPFDYPIALKPTNSVEWLDIHFEGRKKAFTIKSEAEYRDIVGKIYNNGYTSDLIVQDFIPGDDSNMRVLNAYVDKNHHVKMMCLGHPLLEDPAPSAIGNYVTIIPDFDQRIYDQIQKFLESINFTGYANFDMKYDVRDDTYKLFEINLRQGRSSFFVTLNGYNLAQWVVRDYVQDNLANDQTVYANKDPENYYLWLGVPNRVFKKYAKKNYDKEKAEELIRKGQWGTTFWYKKDENFMRWLLMKWMDHNYAKNFKKYFHINKE
ncbi:carboxylate--amine ligase [Fructilactobacillus fructivorans]|uniref:carboxylate--amine ligase n=1 Tax=Fructilactobacillus fructivorans TaxID=1614 RepID=UPI00223B555E|nr:carboxylate--amine ligase [Fructilactobacillus fructivorans]MCT0151970.1 carboxylate--amine ligase [Fructilactobacillus fructivorans]MCT2867862.1 carboxylate--amine ligase [Fructilactobacillus fructivorans]MCT2868556.1 carboxylate--amine ligase [Fructilactobacillus fructivorans]MCT2873556.1 carboxylate--amine ligase [Fructilactobacillus fructivorans]